MKKYRVKYTPTEAYYFGNEKTFSFGVDDKGQMRNSYLIRSEYLPAQSTLLGSLRYIFLPHKNAEFEYSEEQFKDNKSATGDESFNISAKEVQSFGVIKKISPIFLTKNGNIYIKTPLDHKSKSKIGDTDEYQTNTVYTPFKEYVSINQSKSKIVDTDEYQTNTVYTPFEDFEECVSINQKFYAKDFNVKHGITDSYMNITSGKNEIVFTGEIFSRQLRVGIDKKGDKEAFFKKEYCSMLEGWSFCVDVDIDENFKVPEKTEVFLGQGKSVFTVEFISIPTEDSYDEAIEKRIQSIIGIDMVYCASDVLINSTCNALYEDCAFASVKLRDYRAYITKIEIPKDGNKTKKQISKGDTLYKMIAAGSVFKVNQSNLEKFKNHFSNPNCEKIGFNKLIYGGNTK